MNQNHYTSFRICIIVSAIVLGFIIGGAGGCAAKPVKSPPTWIEIEMTRPEYSEKLSQGVRMLFNNPAAFEQIQLVIMARQWEREDKLKGFTKDARGED